MLSVVSILLTERSCLRQWKQRPVSRLIWSANVSSWSIVTPRQVTAGRQATAAEPLDTRTEPWTLASWYCVPRQVNCVFSAFSFSLLEDMQRPSRCRRYTRLDEQTLLHSCQTVYVSTPECRQRTSAHWHRDVQRWRAHQRCTTGTGSVQAHCPAAHRAGLQTRLLASDLVTRSTNNSWYVTLLQLSCSDTSCRTRVYRLV